jgi:hypothetical protein
MPPPWITIAANVRSISCVLSPMYDAPPDQPAIHTRARSTPRRSATRSTWAAIQAGDPFQRHQLPWHDSLAGHASDTSVIFLAATAGSHARWSDAAS